MNAQCTPYFDQAHSPRIANYNIDVRLDHKTKRFEGTETLTWTNTSPDTLNEMRFYMYINSFKNMESTFLKSSSQIFGQDLSNRKKDEWGWIDITEIKDGQNNDLTPSLKYIQTLDNNKLDESILQVKLAKPILPGETIELKLKMDAKMPKTIARTGYGEDDFFMFVHWFPQACVYTTDKDGLWGWNSHQAHRRTEYFADFGNYDVSITAWDQFELGATGCLIRESENNDGTKTWVYHAEDVIDFAWTVYPSYEVVEDQWNHVHIRLLIPPEHCSHGQRLIDAVKYGLEYMDDHVGPYPYTYLTMIDPPMKGLRGGFMEYPTFITGGSFYAWPKYVRSIESLMIHEFAHQYFMGMVANNEKEEAWLDEGFVTYYEDRIMEYGYGEEASLFNLFGYKANNSAFTRNEYTSLKNHRIDIINQPGWESKGNTKAIIYSKTATMLKTLENLVGRTLFDEMIRDYFDTWKFKHPKGKDFRAIAHKHLAQVLIDEYNLELDYFFDQALNTTKVCDFNVRSIQTVENKTQHGWFGSNEERSFEESKKTGTVHSRITIEQLGDMHLPVEVKIHFSDGHEKKFKWDGEQSLKDFDFEYKHPVDCVFIDPEQKILLDIDLNNNSKSCKTKHLSLLKYSAKSTHWFQQILHTVGALL